MDVKGSLFRKIASVLILGGSIIGCGGSGDINIAPVTNDSSVDNSVSNAAAQKIHVHQTALYRETSRLHIAFTPPLLLIPV